MTSTRTKQSETAEGGRRTSGDPRIRRTRAAILTAAEELLSERNFRDIRVNAVADAAGVSPASVYSHFGSKDVLVAATIERLLDTATEEMTAAYRGGTPAVQRFFGAGEAYMRLLLDHPALARYVTVQGLQPPGSTLERAVDARLDRLRDEFEDQIREALAEGAVVDVDPHALSYALFGAWNGIAALTLRRDAGALDREDTERAFRQAAELLVRGLLH